MTFTEDLLAYVVCVIQHGRQGLVELIEFNYFLIEFSVELFAFQKSSSFWRRFYSYKALRNFRKGSKWYGNFLGNFPEKSEDC